MKQLNKGCMANKNLPPFYHLLHLTQKESSLSIVDNKKVPQISLLFLFEYRHKESLFLKLQSYNKFHR